MNRFSCIIFDLDGTLTQTNKLIFATFNHVTQKYLNRTYTPAEITAMFGPPEEVAIERLVGAERAGMALEDFFRFYIDNHREMANAYPGVKEILDYLKQEDILLGVFTGKGSRSTRITLEILGLLPYFDSIVTGTDVLNHKPSGEGIRKILDRFHLEPARTLMVGDAVNDIVAARDAGVAMASVVWDSYGKDKVVSMGADFLFHTVEDLNQWLKSVIPHNGVAVHS